MSQRLTLIVDSGATKTAWLSTDGSVAHTGSGCNPATGALPCPEDMPECQDVAEVWWYGAGCVPGLPSARVAEVLQQRWPGACIHVADDLTGACKALWRHQRGVAAILGTGSNSALWDGCKVWIHTPSLGYILGDEGSGAHLGRTLLNRVLKSQLPAATCQRFTDDTGIDSARAIEMTYRSDRPAARLASLVPWIADNIDKLDGLDALVTECLDEFVVRNLLAYRHPQVAAAGSIAAVFESRLAAALDHYGLTLVKVTANPLQDLVACHCG